MSWHSWFGLPDDNYFDGLDMNDLDLDEAYLRIFNEGSHIPVDFSQTHKDCVECDFYKKMDIYSDEIFKVNSNYRYKINLMNKIICDIPDEMDQFGVYKITINDTDCTFSTEKEAVNIYLPMATVSIIYFFLIFTIWAIRKISRKLKLTNSSDATQNEPSNKKTRIKSLDTFRGISIVIMVFNNLGGGFAYKILEHAPWNGVHLADLPFPCFLWIMGACIPISLTSSFKKGVSNGQLVSAVAERSLKLFCIGIFLQSGIYLDKFRVMGVLQRFGISYFVVTTICILTLKRRLLIESKDMKPRWTTSFETTSVTWIPALYTAIQHLIIVLFVSEEGCERGYFGPGGLHQHGKYQNCTGGATGYLDRAILGDHVFQTPTSLEVYKSLLFEPEGLVGCFNSIFHTFIGVQAGVIILVHKDHASRLAHWLSWSAACLILGGILCGFSRDNGWIPINKNLWSLSFVFILSHIAFLLLSICYVLIDMKNIWGGQPFIYAGMNSILIYIGHETTGYFFPFTWRVSKFEIQSRFLTLLGSVTATAIWMYIAYYLYKIKYFFTV